MEILDKEGGYFMLKLKKWCAVALATVMVAGALGGCQKSSADSQGKGGPADSGKETSAGTQAGASGETKGAGDTGSAAAGGETKGDAANAAGADNSAASGADTNGGSGQQADKKAPEDYVGEIEIWSWSESEVQTLAENFNAVYPNVKIKYVPIDNGDVTMKLQTAAASGGNFPDVAYVELNTRGQLLAMDIWEDLTQEPYNFDKSMVFQPLLAMETTQDGRVVCIDREYNPSGFVFRRSLAEEYLGTDDRDEIYGMISDWDKFVETGKKVLEASGGKVYMLAGLDDINWMLANQYGEEVFSDNTAYLTKYFTHMLTPMVKIRDAGIAGMMKRWTPAWNSSYRDSNVLIYEYAPWSASAAIKANAPDTSGDWSVIEATGGPYIMGGTAYGIPKEAKNKELAWLFIQWTLLTEDGMKACEEDLGSIGPMESYYDDRQETPDEFFNGQDVNKFLLDEIAPKLKLRSVNQYDRVLDEVMGLVIERLQSDNSFDFDSALAYAIEEASNKLPAEMTVE